MCHFNRRVDLSARHDSNLDRKVSKSPYGTGISTKYRRSQERLQDYAFCLEVDIAHFSGELDANRVVFKKEGIIHLPAVVQK